MRRLVAGLVAGLIACGGDPTGPEVDPQVGRACDPELGEFLSAELFNDSNFGSSWRVTGHVTTSTQRDVRRSDGVVIRQVVLRCDRRGCVYLGGGDSMTGDQAIARCLAG